MAAGPMVCLLGPVRLIDAAGQPVDLPSASQRRLLAALAIHAPRAVRAEWLCEALGISPGALRTLVTRVRRTIGSDVLRTSVVGYRLDIAIDAALAGEELDRAGGDAEALRRALDLWVGAPIEEFADESWAVAEAVRLGERHAAAVEDLADALIACGRAAEAAVALEPHVRAHPLRDRPRGQLIRALAATGRQTEALRSFQAYRAYLGESVGTVPSAALQTIEQRVATGWDGIERGAALDRSATPGRRATATAAATLPSALSRTGVLVGRRDELAELAAAAGRSDGTTVVALLTGEAGIGKTTLIAEFARRHCLPAGRQVLYGRCDEVVAEPLQPIRGVIGRLVELLPNDVLTAHRATCGGDLLRLLPQLRGRLAEAAPVGDEATARQLVFDAVVDIVERAAAITPLVLVVDDLHWAEPTALHLLRHLARNLGAAPVLIVAGYRPTAETGDDQLRAAIADLTRGDAVRIELAGLDAPELAELVVARLSADAGREVGGHDVAFVAELLRTETAGNPLYAEQLLRHWEGAGRLRLAGGTVSLDPAPPPDVPATLRDLVWHRVGGLGPQAQTVLGAAAVLGVQFDERVLVEMTGVDPHELDELLDRAAAAGLLVDGGSRGGPTRFVHALVARALEAELGSRARARLHGRALAALQAPGRTPSAARLAHHAAAAGSVVEALQWAIAAGERAHDVLAFDEELAWFTAALGHADALGRPDDERAELLVRIGEAGYRAGAPDALDRLYQGAMLAARCGADATVRRAALATYPGAIEYGAFAPRQLAIAEQAMARLDGADHDTRVRLTARFAQSLAATERTAERTQAARTAYAAAHHGEDPLLLARVAPDLVYASWGPGLSELRAELLGEVLALVETTNDPRLVFAVHQVGHLAAVCAGDAVRAQRCLDGIRSVTADIGDAQMRWTLGIIDGFDATMRAHFAEAEQIIAATFELGLRIAEPLAVVAFSGQLFMTGTFAGRHAELLPILEQMVDTAEPVEQPFRLAHAIVCAEVGRPEVAAAILAEARAQGLDSIPDDLVRTTTLLGYVVLTLETGDLESAAWLYPAIAPMAGEVAFNGITSQGPIAAYVGRLASVLGDHATAERHLLDALATTEAFGWSYHRATNLLALAQNEFWTTGRLDGRGEQWLATAELLCARHGLAVWARRAAVLRAALPGTTVADGDRTRPPAG